MSRFTRGKPVLNEKYAMLNQGLAPMGIYIGKPILELPPKTLLYYSDKFEYMDATVYGRYIRACIDAAISLGYIQERDRLRQEQHKINLRSNHIGQIGQRIIFESLIVDKLYVNKDRGYTTNVLMSDDNILKYFGPSLGKEGDIINVKATIKRHDVWKDVKSTTIERPKVL